VAFGSVVLEGFYEEFGVALDLEEATAVVGSADDEEGAGAGCSAGNRHMAIVTVRTSWALQASESKGFCLRTRLSAVS